jgi:hypothetical protein
MAVEKIKITFNPLSGNFDSVLDPQDLVDGPSSATDLAIAIFDGITGKLLKNSLALVQSDGRITLGADGTASLDAITKQQLDAAIQGVKVKQGVRAASTADLTLSGEQTVDGIALVTGDRVLVKDQTSTEENGIYIVSAGAWSRSTDADIGSELSGAFVSVKLGTDNAATGWWQANIVTTIGTDPVQFNQFFGAGSFTADGQGIELTGSTFSLELDGSTLSKSAAGLRVAALGITNAEVSNSAAIAYSKLALTNSIVNADINASAAIAYSKLALTDTIVNADINSAAAIDYSKLALSNSIVNADINASASIDYSKLAALTADRALVSSGSGFVSASTATATEVGYLSGVTSSIQDQLNTKFGYNVQSINSDITLSAGIVYLLDTSANRTVTLPAPVNNASLTIKDSTGNAEENVITISAGAALVDGAASYIMSSEYESITLVSSGTNWFLI